MLIKIQAKQISLYVFSMLNQCYLPTCVKRVAPVSMMHGCIWSRILEADEWIQRSIKTMNERGTAFYKWQFILTWNAYYALSINENYKCRVLGSKHTTITKRIKGGDSKTISIDAMLPAVLTF